MPMATAYARLEKNLENVNAALQQHVGVAKDKKLRLISYEAGQHLLGTAGFFSVGREDSLPAEKQDLLVKKFHDINAGAPMKDVYTKYLALWLERTNDLFVNFTDVGRTNQYGSWGVKEYLGQPRAEAPKYDAILTFIDAHRGAVP